jgi:sulfur carrier protein ThiS
VEYRDDETAKPGLGPSGCASLDLVKVKLRNPDREVEVAGERKVHDLLGELGINPDTVLVIRERELLTREDRVREQDEIEVRPVISGGGGG